MQIAIIGLPRSGKTTLFNAVTRGTAATAVYADKPNFGVAKVPDERLDVLADIYKPKRVVQAEVEYTDIPPMTDGLGKSQGIGGEYLNFLQSSDAILVVLRSFNDPSVAHVNETIDPFRDLENVTTEMTLSDLEVLDRRMDRIQGNLKAAKQQERDILMREQSLLDGLSEKLNKGVALKDQCLSSEEMKKISGFGLLSIKPLIIAMNIGENQIGETDKLEEQLASSVTGDSVRTVVTCGQIEMELAQMDPKEEMEFRKDLRTGESSLRKMIRISYDVVDQISFFTVGADEVRAWEVGKNTVAQKAAGKIHTDLERGFIRAEVIPFSDLVECGGLGVARKRGLLRQEGKNYLLGDGEIMHVLFNV